VVALLRPLRRAGTDRSGVAESLGAVDAIVAQYGIEPLSAVS
jgi:hypothetical protein